MFFGWVTYRRVAIKDIHGGDMYWGREGNSMSNRESKDKNYRIDIGAYGAISVEAPTKEDCLELFKEVTSIKRASKLDEAIR